MGNCCGGGSSSSDNEAQNLTAGAGGRRSKENGNVKPFQGEGRRLGTAADPAAKPTPARTPSPARRDEANDGGAPVYDAHLSEEDRSKTRSDLAAAAEARLKKQGGVGSPSKKKASSGAPLTGPNSQPTMRWTAG